MKGVNDIMAAELKDPAAAVAGWVDTNPLRRYRHEHQPRMTIAQAAALLEVSLVSIQKWEMGAGSPDESNMDKLSKLMGKEVIGQWTKWQEQRPQI